MEGAGRRAKKFGERRLTTASYIQNPVVRLDIRPLQNRCGQFWHKGSYVLVGLYRESTYLVMLELAVTGPAHKSEEEN